MDPVEQEKNEWTLWLSVGFWGWGLLLAAGAFWQSGDWKRPAVVLAAFLIFWAVWKFVMRQGAARAAEARESTAPTEDEL